MIGELRQALDELGFLAPQREALLRRAFRRVGVPPSRATTDDLLLVMQQTLPELIREHIPAFVPAGKYESLLRQIAPAVPDEESIVEVKLSTPEGRRELSDLLGRVKGLAGIYMQWEEGEEHLGEALPQAVLNLLRSGEEVTEEVGGRGILLAYEQGTYAAKRVEDGFFAVHLHPWAGYGILLNLMRRMR